MTARERLAELHWLLDGGAWPPTACARVDWTVYAAEKVARAHGDLRLVRVLGPHVHAARAAA